MHTLHTNSKTPSQKRLLRFYIKGVTGGEWSPRREAGASQTPWAPIRTGSNPDITSTTNGELCIALTCATRFAVELFGE
ncbi:unannotated protein [freshwater metagenome]|uniref:Unannotated protein n=1 Tax=freshwater metagenome TaxID=449393 RepID=A0A6J6CU64_9ZZZZ